LTLAANTSIFERAQNETLKGSQESITVEQAMNKVKESLEAAFLAEDRLKELLIRDGLLQ